MKNSLDDKKVKKVKKKTIAGDIMGGLNKLKKQALNSDQKHHHHQLDKMATLKKGKTKS